MPLQVVSSATLTCSMGGTPSRLVVAPTRQRTAAGLPAANVGDHVALRNILPFGPCRSPAFPATAVATAAAGGVLTPAPCVPGTITPWAPGSPVTSIAERPALRDVDTCRCAWGGTIAIADPGQAIVTAV